MYADVSPRKRVRWPGTQQELMERSKVPGEFNKPECSGPAPACVALLLLLVCVAPVWAAQIPGVMPPPQPGMDRLFEVFVGNDIFSIGNYPDDYRTQQFALAMQINERWSVVVDHSILTLTAPEASDSARLDQLSGSIGYLLSHRRGSNYRQEVEIGAGLRSYGEHAGARMQNGFHQLIGNSIETMPYVDEERTDATAWLRLQRDGVLLKDLRAPILGGNWDFGYWARGATLITSDGQWDGNVGLMAVVTKRWFQAWLGAEADWRSGYSRENVSGETAANEEGVGVVFGLRVGPFLMETERQISGDSVYGHASFVSTGEALWDFANGDNRFGTQLGLTLPDVYVMLQGRWSNCNVLGCSENWQRTVVLGLLTGKPQFGSDVTKFVETWQIGVTYEFEHAPFERYPWMTGYGALGAGWRSERVEIEYGMLEGAQSESVDRPGFVGETGLRVSTMAGNERLGLLLQVGLAGWLPSSDGHVQIGGETLRLQGPELIMTTSLLLRLY